ncbi:hypothetical protein LTR22_025507 [Elasticomyces elasticus]|nr:hypothetical protein LTR22_025507 [Elasticomyces elasticus]
MRLLNTNTLRFSEYFDRPVPRYAILSHRWDEEEISFQNFTEGKAQMGRGSAKVMRFCEFARSQPRPHQWVWLDTCCIDKRSSAELGQAINSMYAWYQNAEVCYVYLKDLPSTTKSKAGTRPIFRRSVWFRRGWTLQELLAPSHVIFCDRNWRVLGSKSELARDITTATGIPQAFLNGNFRPRDASIAMRMSWASKRITTRLEDMAYCLLGLFNVNMSMLYGEGQKAFMRLQQEIISRSDDESIFAWRSNEPVWGMLASSPQAFGDSGTIVNIQLSPEERLPYRMTNKGLQIQSASDTHASDEIDPSTLLPMGYDSHFLELGCFYGARHVMTRQQPDADAMWERSTLTIELRRTGQFWQRFNCHQLGSVTNADRGRRQNGTFVGRSVQRTYYVMQSDL